MSVVYESADGIATVTIDRADRMNALDSAVVDGLEASWKRFADSDGSSQAGVRGISGLDHGCRERSHACRRQDNQ